MYILTLFTDIGVHYLNTLDKRMALMWAKAAEQQGCDFHFNYIPDPESEQHGKEVSQQ